MPTGDARGEIDPNLAPGRPGPNFALAGSSKFGLAPDPFGQDFSGSRAVTSRNRLLHDGATNATWSLWLDTEVVPPSPSGVPGAEIGRSLATANFGELSFYEVR
jgi:hypothetical protein